GGGALALLQAAPDGEALLLPLPSGGAPGGRAPAVIDAPGSMSGERRLVRASYSRGALRNLRPIVSSPDLIAFARISPDRKWIAHAAKDAEGATRIFVRRFDGSSRSVPVTPAGAAE